MSRITILAFLPLLWQSQSVGQSPPVLESNEPLVRSSVKEVVLDVVVRQKNKQLARKLKPSDFAITEDGVPQTIKAFRLITGKETNPPVEQVSKASEPTGVAPETPRKMQEPSFVSIVFDEISPDSRKYAHDAVRAFLNQELRPATYIAIFTLNYQMDVLQSFTHDRTLLLTAADRASVGNYSSLSRDNATVMNQADYSVAGGPGGISIQPSVDLTRTRNLGTGGADVAVTEGAQAAAKIVSDQREIAMYQGGMRTVVALMNLVKYESSLPGRKTVLYLSEGLNLPPDQHSLISNVISSANRGNVSFYGIDVRGLKTGDPDALATNMASTAASISASQHSRPTLVTEAMAKQDDKIIEGSVANVQQNMDELARGTGGFLVANTNEIARAMLRVMEDVRTHYEISYVPASDVYDGHFRKIQVSVSNPKLTVQSRDGYYALPDLNGQAVLPFEMAGLHALEGRPGPSAFPFRMAAMRFRPVESGFAYEIAFDLPIANITPHADPQNGKVRLHATFLALVKDSRGSVVDKISQDIDRDVPGDKIDQFEKGDLIVTKPLSLAPGRYTVEAAVVDSQGDRASTKRAVLIVPQRGALSLSDIALVHEFLPLTDPRDPGDPLEFSGGKVTPELGSRSSADADTSLFFVVYPTGGAPKPKVTIRFFRDGAEIARNEPQLSEPDEINSIPVIASAKLPVGDYQAQVTVQQGDHIMRRATAFTVAAE